MAENDLHPPGTTVAVGNRGPDGKWELGTYKGVEPGGLHRVGFSATGSEDRHFEADRIRGPGEIYIDARGAEMEPMSFSKALEIVHDLARQHQPARNDDPANEVLTGVLKWQAAALATLEDLVVNHHENIDEAFRPPVASGQWPEASVGCHRGLDPDEPVEAVRICLELGETGIPEPTSRDPEEADAIDAANQACDLVRDLVGAHGGELASRLTVLRGSRPE
jgi:hypothetical protein